MADVSVVTAMSHRSGTSGVLLGIVAVTTAVAFDNLAAVAMLPAVVGDLGAGGLYPWVLNTYLLGMAVGTLLSGPMIDSMGVSRTSRAVMCSIVASAVACALAPSVPALIVTRLLVGLGVGVATCVPAAAIGIAFSAAARARGFALNSAIWGLLGFAGPPAASALAEGPGWRWTFMLVAGLAACAAALGQGFPGFEREARSIRMELDGRGLALVAMLTLVVLLGATQLSGWLALSVPALAALAYVYWRHARRNSHPILRLQDLAHPPFGVLNLLGFCSFAVPWGIAAYLPILVVSGLGRSASLGAFSVSSLSVGWLLGSMLAGTVVPTFGGTRTAVASLAGIVLGAGMGAAVLRPGITTAELVGFVMVLGLAGGLLNNAALSLVSVHAASAGLGRSMAAHQYLRNLGNALGAAMTGGVILLVVSRAGLDADRVLGEGSADAAPVGALLSGFRWAVVVSLVLAAGALVTFVRNRPPIAPAVP